MKKSTKTIWGIVLLVLGAMASFGKIMENILNGSPWYIIKASGGEGLVFSQALGNLAAQFMLFIGGIVLLVSANGSKQNPEADAGFVRAEKKRENAFCIIGFAFSIIGFFVTSIIKYPILPAITLILAVIGLNTARKKSQSGTGFGKWALTISVSALLSALILIFFPSLTDSENLMADDTPWYEAENDADEPDAVYSPGIITDSTYESEFVGLRYVKPSDWIIYTDEEIEEMKNDGGLDCEFMTANPNNPEAISIYIGKDIGNISLEEYSEITMSDFEKKGITLVKDRGMVEFNGAKYRSLIYSVDNNGVPVTTELNLRKKGTCIIYITVQYAERTNSTIEEALDGFSKY